MRTLGFNSHLRMNDSLLAQSYVEAYDISYPEALRLIEKDVEDLRQQLENEGTYALNGLGTLTLNMDGTYEFEPFKSGLLSPEIYGLSGLNFKRLHDESMQEVASVNAVEPQSPEMASTALLDLIPEEEDDSKAVNIKMSWIRNAVAIAAAVVAFFLYATPVVNSDLGSQSMSQLQGNILYKMIPQDTNATPAQPVTAKAEKPVKAPDAPVEQPAVKQQEAPQAAVADKPATSAPTYYVVVASQVKKSNAEEFVERLHKQGYTEAEVLIYNDVVRVVCGSFPTEADAYQQLNKLNSKDEFAEAWVFKKKS